MEIKGCEGGDEEEREKKEEDDGREEHTVDEGLKEEKLGHRWLYKRDNLNVFIITKKIRCSYDGGVHDILVMVEMKLVINDYIFRKSVIFK